MGEAKIDTGQQTSGDKRIGVLGAMAIGIGGMVGGGIFAVLGTAVSVAGGGTPVAFLIAGVVALLTAYAYAKLSVRFPSAGGTVVFIDRAFGVDFATGTFNLILWLSYLVTVALYAVAFGSYAGTFFPAGASPLPRHLLISAGIILPAIINLLNADIISKSETAIVLLKLALLALVVSAGTAFVNTTAIKPATWPGPLNLIVGGMVIFVAYEGFELIANAGGDVRDPQHTLPRAFYGSVLFVIILYVLVAIITVGCVPADKIKEAKDYALAVAARPALGDTGFTLVAISALLATFSAINATIYGNARLGYSLAKDGEFPESLERKVWNRPIGGVLLTTVLSLLLANLVDLTAIAIMGSAGFLLIFAVVNAAAWKLAPAIGASRWVCLLGSLACTAALCVLLYQTYIDTPLAFWVFMAIVGSALGFELIYPKVSGRKLRIRGPA